MDVKAFVTAVASLSVDSLSLPSAFHGCPSRSLSLWTTPSADSFALPAQTRPTLTQPTPKDALRCALSSHHATTRRRLTSRGSLVL